MRKLWLDNLRRPTHSTSYVPQIDGLRFLALLPVLIWHAGLRGERFFLSHSSTTVSHSDRLSSWIPHGHIGVFIFFFISGYIISYPFFQGRAPGLSSFYKRRLLRLEPPYMLVMALMFVVLKVTGYRPEQAPSFESPDVSLVASFVASLTYMHGLLFNAPPRLNPPAWSLEIEVQFYLVAPFIVACITAAAPSRWAGVLAVVACIAVEAVLRSAFGIHGLQERTLFAHAYGFVLGIAVCQYAARQDPFSQHENWIYDALGVLSLLVLVGSGILQHWSLSPLEEGGVKIVRAVTMVGVYLGAARGIRMKAVLGSAPLAVVGGMCYSVYLVHVPLMHAAASYVFKHYSADSQLEGMLVSCALLIPISLLGGLVYYVAIERPCMAPNWPQRFWARLIHLLRGGYLRAAPPR